MDRPASAMDARSASQPPPGPSQARKAKWVPHAQGPQHREPSLVCDSQGARMDSAPLSGGAGHSPVERAKGEPLYGSEPWKRWCMARRVATAAAPWPTLRGGARGPGRRQTRSRTRVPRATALPANAAGAAGVGPGSGFSTQCGASPPRTGVRPLSRHLPAGAPRRGFRVGTGPHRPRPSRNAPHRGALCAAWAVPPSPPARGTGPCTHHRLPLEHRKEERPRATANPSETSARFQLC